MLINLEEVGDFGSRSDDVVLLGLCDDIVRKLCKKLGWEEELDAAWKETENSVTEFNEVRAEVDQKISEAEVEKDSAWSLGGSKQNTERQMLLEEEIERITEKVGKSLEITTGSKENPTHPDESTDSPEPTSGEEAPVLTTKSENLSSDEKEGGKTTDSSKL